MIRFFSIVTCLTIFISCGDSSNKINELDSPHSYSNNNEVVIKHIDLQLDIDFERKRIDGIAEITINNLKNTDSLVLDTYDLAINKITLGKNEAETKFRLGKKDSILGSSLTITIEPTTKIVKVYYTTSANSKALQWLEPAQTTDKNYPLYTLSQRINARSWIPCQDNPGVRFTYNAKVKVPKNLLALMSANNPKEKNDTGIYNFEMSQPIPSYSLALVVGDIKFSELGPRTGVYAEPSLLAKAALEFIDTERMIRAAENIYGPYLLGRYDMIVLPLIFPYAGVDNPRLTFLSPTLLAGDKSLTRTVAHSIANSWADNLIANLAWNDFWLKAGFTSYFEQRIIEEVYGFEYKEMLVVLDYQNLIHELDKMGKDNPGTCLYFDTAKQDPNERAREVAQDKGALFLRTIEETVGREKFDKFLSKYFDEFNSKTMTSDNFVEYLNDNLIDGNSELEEKLMVSKWVFEPGLPAKAFKPSSEQFEIVDKAVVAWLNEFPADQLDTELWNAHHYVIFISKLPKTMSKTQMRQLDNDFGFTQTQNAEILQAWLHLVIHNKFTPAYDRLENFLMNAGRVKFLKSLYSKLAETDEGKTYALNIYEKARSLYHPIAQNTVDKILGLK